MKKALVLLLAVMFLFNGVSAFASEDDSETTKKSNIGDSWVADALIREGGCSAGVNHLMFD